MDAGGIYRVSGVFNFIEIAATADFGCQLLSNKTISDKSSISIFGDQVRVASVSRGQYGRSESGDLFIGSVAVIGWNPDQGTSCNLQAIVYANAFQDSTLKLQWHPNTLTTGILRMYANSWMQLEKIN